MEDTLQISAIEKDDSFSILYASLETVKRNQMDPLTEAKLFIGKLGEVRGKYEDMSYNLVIQLDDMEAQHASEKAAMIADYQGKLKKLQDDVERLDAALKVKEVEQNGTAQSNETMKHFLFSIRTRKYSEWVFQS